MPSTNIQKKIFPKLYNYKNQFIAELTEAIQVTETLRFGSLGTLTFQYPYYLIDSFGVVQKDSLGNPIKNPKVDFIENDFLCLFDENWYIIKIDEDMRTEDNKVLISCTCHSIAYELQELMVQYLNLNPPTTYLANASTAISSVLNTAQELRRNIVAGASASTLILDSNAHTVNGYYNGCKVTIISGVGSGQTRTVTSYDATSKVITVSPNWSQTPQQGALYAIYNDIWSIGTVDPVFNTSYRNHLFDFVNALDALQQVRDKYLDNNDEPGYLTYSASFNIGTGRWEKKVNLIRSKPYSGVEFRYKKNLNGVNRQKYTNELYTRIIPSGINNLGVNGIPTSNRTDSGVTYPEHIFGTNLIENYQYFLGLGYTYKECIDNFNKTYYFDDTRYTNQQDLYNDCKKLLLKASVPKIVYTAKILDLSTITGREYESFKIGDTIRVHDEEIGFGFNATVSFIEKSQDFPQNATIELTNFMENFSDVVKRLVGVNEDYTNRRSRYGNTATYIVADRRTSKNWRQADYVVEDFQDAVIVVQTALAAANIAGGGTVVLLEGDYYFDNTLTMYSNVSVIGQGSGTRIFPRAITSICFYAEEVENISIENLSIKPLLNSQGQLSQYFLGAIQLIFVSNVKIKNVDMMDVERFFIDANEVVNLEISGCSFNSTGIITTIQDLSAFYGIILENVNIYNNRIVGKMYGGIVIGENTNATSFYVNNNYISISDPTGVPARSVCIDVYGISGGSIIVSNNTAVTIGANSAGISVYSENCSTVISNNIIEGSITDAAILARLALNSNGVSIKDNIIRMATSTALTNAGVKVMSTTGTPTGVSIQGNNVKRIYSVNTNLRYGVWIQAGVTGAIVSGNDLNLSGTVSSFFDQGTSTLTLGGNKL